MVLFSLSIITLTGGSMLPRGPGEKGTYIPYTVVKKTCPHCKEKYAIHKIGPMGKKICPSCGKELK
jgi:hypothetical protein